MLSEQGKLNLQTWFGQFGPDEDIEEIMYFGFGRGRTAGDYHTDLIEIKIDDSKKSDRIRFVVKFFKNMDIYAAWIVGSEGLRKRYTLFTRDLGRIEEDLDCDYASELITEDRRVYFFRGKEGFRKFVENNLPVLQTV